MFKKKISNEHLMRMIVALFVKSGIDYEEYVRLIFDDATHRQFKRGISEAMRERIIREYGIDPDNKKAVNAYKKKLNK